MNRPTEFEAAVESELAGLVPAAPSPDLRRRVAESLAAAPSVQPSRGHWLTERLLWACGGAAAGALAASVAFTLRPAAALTPDPASAPAAAVAAAASPVEVTEKSVTWADGGVQFLDDRTPARVLRRIAVERHRPAGGREYLVPREDVVLMPVALR